MINLLPEKELRKWVCDMVNESSEFRARLQAKIDALLGIEDATYDSARKKIAEIFHAPYATMTRSSRRWGSTECTNWTLVLQMAEPIFAQAEKWAGSGYADAALGVALQVFSELAELVDDEVLHGYVAGVYECAARMRTLLRDGLLSDSLSKARIPFILEELRRLAMAPMLAGDGLDLTDFL